MPSCPMHLADTMKFRPYLALKNSITTLVYGDGIGVALELSSADSPSQYGVQRTTSAATATTVRYSDCHAQDEYAKTPLNCPAPPPPPPPPLLLLLLDGIIIQKT
ncbi:hypothetical protein EAI_06190 [Harpegnathos saltator]|uniref:Uncharacterized protein n=1 Tax=Harpegnathos saltator TaxID=610380 RepID=E2B4S1_HARSA|nr:hypothetical protein EAI_06190 [Harpegnathos saltator]